MWTSAKYNCFLDKVKSYSDEEYKKFNSKIVKTSYKMLGVRMPILDRLSKKIDPNDIDSFYNVVTFKYYEEVMILGLVIARVENDKVRDNYFNKFTNKIDNWAICDAVINRFKLKDEELDSFLPYIKKYLESKNEFTLRCGFVFLLNYYVKKKYLTAIFELINNNTNNSYYVEMAISWLLSYCYLLDKNKTIDFITTSNISDFVYNKTISKIRDSLRVSKEEKENLKLLLKKG